MTGGPWNSKDDRKDTDISDSNFTGTPPEVTRLGEWSTSRRELWGFYLYYVVRFFSVYFLSHLLSSTQRAIMDSPDSTLARLNSRISSISLAMTRASHHSPNNAAAGPIACYPIWDASAIVCLSLASLIGFAFVVHEPAAPLLFINLFCYG
jgi:hypothetical protein